MSVTLNLQNLKANDLGLEAVFYKRHSETELELISTYELSLEWQKESQATYSCDVIPPSAGVYEYGFRLYPKNDLLVHRQDFGLVRWL